MKTRRMIGGGSVLAVAALGVTACGDGGTTPALDDALLLNAAAVVADATVEDVAIATAHFGFGVQSAPSLASGTGGEPGQPGGRRGIGAALSGTHDVTFYDASGNVQDAYDPSTTESIHFVLDVAGDVSRGPWSASITRSRDMTVSGLEGEETTRTFNGSGSETISRSRTLDDGSTATHEMSGTFSYDALVVPAPGSDPKWPLSGSIHRTMTVSAVNGPRGDVSRTLDVTVTFDGDSTATAVINGETVEIDLSTRDGHFPIRIGRFGRGG